MPQENKPQAETFFAEKVLQSRVVVLSDTIKAELAQKIVQQLVLMDQAESHKPIVVLINSPGGELYSGFAIFDMLRMVRSPVVTVVLGLAASMGSLIALAPPLERRLAFPQARFMIHQPLLTGYQGRTTDIEIQAKEILRERERVVQLYEQATGKNSEDVAKDIDRDNWLSAEEAKDYGLISGIIQDWKEFSKLTQT